jgi:tetratricopeptide (TPR) repeat protein
MFSYGSCFAFLLLSRSQLQYAAWMPALKIHALDNRLNSNAFPMRQAFPLAGDNPVAKCGHYVPSLLATIFCVFLVSFCGCCSFRNKPVADNIYESRELTYSGIHAQQRGDHRRAATIFAKAVDICPEDYRARFLLAETSAAQGEPGQAIKHMSRAWKLSEEDPEIGVRLGTLLLQTGDSNRALMMADNAIAKNRRLASAWELRANASRAQGRIEESLDNYLTALTLQTDLPSAQLAASEIYLELDKPQRALACLSQLQSSYADGEAPEKLLMLQAAALQSLQRHSEAVDRLTMIAQRENASPDLLLAYSQALVQSGQSISGKMVLQKASQRFPADVRFAQAMQELNTPQTSLTSARTEIPPL